MMLLSSSSVVTCKETSSSPHVTISTARHLQNRSVQADHVDVDRPMCRAVSVADAAVEVGESLLAADSERNNREVAQTSPVPSVTAVSVQSNPVCTDMNAAAAAIQQSTDLEPLPDGTVASQNCRQQQEHTVILEQLPDHESGSNYHVSESLPAIVIVPDESMSPGYHLSCDEHSSCENNAEMSGPLDNLAQCEISVQVEPVVSYGS